MKNLVIFGSGGFGREVHQLVKDINFSWNEYPKWNLVGFLDGNTEKHGSTIHELPVLGGVEWLADNPDTSVVVAIGSPAAKRRVVEQIRSLATAPFATLVHPKAWLGDNVTLGEGCILCAGNMITTDIRIGKHVIVNLSCTVGHDAVIEDYVTVFPGVNVSGAVHVQAGADLGTGAKIIPGVTVGQWSIVGAGAVVVRNIPANVTAVGAPAKTIKERPDGWHRG